jgi:hypothetical protein
MSNYDTLSTPTTSIAFSPHCRFERLRQYGLSLRDIADALGSRFLLDGQPSCRRSDRGPSGDLPVPAVGAPILIGRSDVQARRPRWVVLGRTRSGRRVHVVVAAEGQRATIITVWCPDDIELLDHWHHHALLPTSRGSLSLPPTHWYLSDRYPTTGALVGAR